MVFLKAFICLFVSVLGLCNKERKKQRKQGLSLVAEAVTVFSCCAQVSHCRRFSRCGAQALGHKGICSCGGGSTVASPLEDRLGSCGAWA